MTGHSYLTRLQPRPLDPVWNVSGIPMLISDVVPEGEFVATFVDGRSALIYSPMTEFRMMYPDGLERLNHLAEFVGLEMTRRLDATERYRADTAARTGIRQELFDRRS
jgi:hypothetical protein